MPRFARTLPLACSVLAFLVLGFRPALAQIETKEAEIPKDEKAKETSMILFCRMDDDEFQVYPASRPNDNIEKVEVTLEGDAIKATLKEKLTGFKELRARVSGVRACTYLAVPVSARGGDYREVKYTFTMKNIEWTKNPDEWFTATQLTEAKAIQACNLIIAGDLAKAVAALKEAQALAENIEYGTSPFQHFGAGHIAWADMIVSLEQVQKDKEVMLLEPGGFDELQATLRFYYEWSDTFPSVHIRKMDFQALDVLNGLTETARKLAKDARSRLVGKLKTGTIKVGPEETQRAIKEWSLGYLTTLAYMLFQVGQYASVYEVVRDAVMLKESVELGPKEHMIEDLAKWMATRKDFLASLPAEAVKRFPGTLEQMVHKIDASDNLATIKQEAIESLGALKKNHAEIAWDPPIDSMIAKLKEGLPDDLEDPHERHEHPKKDDDGKNQEKK